MSERSEHSAGELPQKRNGESMKEPSLVKHELMEAAPGTVSREQPLDGVIESTEHQRDAGIGLSHGRSLQISNGDRGDTLTVCGTRGEVELRVTLTDKGPVLHFAAAEISLDADRVEVGCDDFHVGARNSIQLECEGNLIHRAHGDASIRAQEGVAIEGQTALVRAMLGDVKLQANDDVRVKGERIRLNC